LPYTIATSLRWVPYMSTPKHLFLRVSAVCLGGILILLACEPTTRPSSDGVGAAEAGPSDATVGAAEVSATDLTAAAVVNRALRFVGANYVNVPDNNLLDLTNTWTLEAWVKPTDASTGSDQDIISKWASVYTASYILQINSTGKLRLVTNNGVTQSIIISTGTLGERMWNHVAATYSNGTVSLYLNGALDRTVSGVLTPLVSTEPVAFGREGTYNGDTFKGALDEIRIWNVVRSGQQIAGSLTRRLQGSETGLVGYWRFDEGGGQKAGDATGHGLNGRLGETPQVDTWDPIWSSITAPIY
jgi:hypothetical protein